MATSGSRIYHSRISVGAVLAIALASVIAAPADDENAPFQQLLESRVDAIVTVKLVLSIKGGFMGADGQEIEQEVSALMIEPHGLVLASSTELGGIPPTMRRIMARMGSEITVIPRDIKVLVGDDTEGLDAELLARDSELDLAWVKIKDPGEKTFPAVDLTRSIPPKLGQRLLALTRMDKYFDRAPIVTELRVAGVTTKPRKLFVPSTIVAEGFCTPVFTTDSALVGVTILQFPELDVSGENPFAMAGATAGLETVMSGFILPAEEIVKATERAKQSAAEQAQEGAADEPAEPEGASEKVGE